MLWRRFSARLRRARGDRRGVAAVEFAMVSFPFLLLLCFIFEISLDLFQQEALDAGLHQAVRQVQTGNAQNIANGAQFISTTLCPNVAGLLNCSDLFIKVQKLNLSSGTSVTAGGKITINGGYSDYYAATSGQLPMRHGALDLAGFGSANFCNAGPSEFLLVTAIYTTPGIIGGLLPTMFSVSYQGGRVNATMSQVAAVSENYPVTAAVGTVAPPC